MEEKRVILSERLQMLARMVTPGNRVADVGCDHGFLSIYLVQAGISPRVVAMDVREGPLAAAREHVGIRRLGAYIEIRKSDGLKQLRPEEADTVVCAGMGGPLMERILTEGKDKAQLLRELILQPQSEIPAFRSFLRRAGYRVISEDMVCDGGKYYFAIRVLPRGDGTEPETTPGDEIGRYDKFGERLLLERHPVLERYLRRRETLTLQLEEELERQGTERTKERLREVRQELEDIRWGLTFFDRT